MNSVVYECSHVRWKAGSAVDEGESLGAGLSVLLGVAGSLNRWANKFFKSDRGVRKPLNSANIFQTSPRQFCTRSGLHLMYEITVGSALYTKLRRKAQTRVITRSHVLNWVLPKSIRRNVCHWSTFCPYQPRACPELEALLPNFDLRHCSIYQYFTSFRPESPQSTLSTGPEFWPSSSQAEQQEWRPFSKSISEFHRIQVRPLHTRMPRCGVSDLADCLECPLHQ